MNYKLDLVKSPDDPRDWKYSTYSKNNLVGNALLPESLDLRSNLPNVRDQGKEGACAAFASCTMREYQEKKDCNFTNYLSPWFLYLNRENQDSSGMHLRNCMDILKNLGVCPETVLPYENVKTKSEITSDVYDSAKLFLITSYVRVETIEEVKKALVEKGPCIVAFPVYAFTTQFWKKVNENDSLLGGHAVCIVGYDSKKGFLIRNSWGETWGEKGYTWYPYTDWGSHWEIWACLDAPTNQKDVKKYKSCGCFSFLKN